MFVKQRIYYGLILTVLTLLLCYFISLRAFDGNTYYVAQLIPLFMGLYVLIGWIIHIRKDKGGVTASVDMPDTSSPQVADPFWEDTLYTVLWAACMLALAATMFYWLFGIGAKFYN